MVFRTDGTLGFQRINTSEDMDIATLSELLRVYWQAYQLEALILEPEFRTTQYLFNMSPGQLRNPSLDLRHLSPRIDRVFAEATPLTQDRLAPIKISGIRISSPGIVELQVLAGVAAILLGIVTGTAIAFDRVSATMANRRRRDLALRRMEAEVLLFERAIDFPIEEIDLGRVAGLARVLQSTKAAQQIERLAVSKLERLAEMKSGDLIDFEELNQTSFLDDREDDYLDEGTNIDE